ncbi:MULTISPECIES: SPOR domain-containing protein [Streptomyces]|uniref:SPOR domain-containing protein n=1 Tax=Streptomyces TaxID=1883 RepID=UPI00345C1F33
MEEDAKTLAQQLKEMVNDAPASGGGPKWNKPEAQDLCDKLGLVIDLRLPPIKREVL